MSKAIRALEGYKETELETIQKEWAIVKVDHFCDVKTGGTPSTKHKDYWDGDIPWMSSGEINKKFVYNTEKKITQKGLENSNARILPADSVMIALNGQGKTRGSVAVLKVPSTCNQSLACIVPDKKISHYLYLFYNLQSRYSEIRNYTGDTGREGLNLRIIKDIKVPLPPFPEQQKIASILSKVDEQIEQTEQIIEKTEILKKGLMQKLLTKGIGHTKFKKTELGEIPEEWDVVTIGDVITLQRGHDLPVTERTEGDFPVVGSNGIVGYHNEYKAKGPGVSMGRSGTIGKIYYCDSNYWPLNTSLYVKDFKNNNPKFISYLLQSLDYERFNSGTSVPTLNRNLVHPYKIAFPKQKIEQQRIASILSKVDSQIQDNQNYLTKLQELKKGLMQDLLTGKVRVCV